MNAELMVRKLLQKLRAEGVLAACRSALSLVRRPVQDEFDRQNGTDTGGLAPLWALSIDSPNAQFGERYEATTEAELTAAIAWLGEDVRDFTFVDLGCGKGRTLIIASRLGFAQVIGVEFAKELADLAARNLAKCEVGRSQVVHGDAAAFAFPDRSIVVYMYNPFSTEVLAKVLTNLASIRSKQVYVIYKSPRGAALLDTAQNLVRQGSPLSAPHMHIWRRLA